MVDRPRTPIRPAALLLTELGADAHVAEVGDLDDIEQSHDLDVETNALAARELDDLLERDREQADEGGVTRTLAGDELDHLLAISRHRSLATIPDTGLVLGQDGELLEEGDLVDEEASTPPEPDPEAAAKPAPSARRASAPLAPRPQAKPSAPHARASATPRPRPAPAPAPAPVAAPASPVAPPVAAPPSPPAPTATPSPAPPAAAAPPPAAVAPPPAAAAPPPVQVQPTPSAFAGAVASSSTSPGAWAMGQPEPAVKPAGLPSIPEWPGASAQAKRRRTVAIGGVVAAAVLAVVLYLAFGESGPDPAATPTPSATTAEAPPPPPPRKTADPGPSQAEADAKDALTKLRDGIGDCVRHGIGTLPGSSPAIPSTLQMSKAPGYASTPQDWRTAVWSCAHFQVKGPMRFQVQWQLLKPSAEGIGVVWIDDDADGKAERALGFHVTLKGKRDPVLGEIGPIDASPIATTY